jgi:hypothetical protein
MLVPALSYTATALAVPANPSSHALQAASRTPTRGTPLIVGESSSSLTKRVRNPPFQKNETVGAGGLGVGGCGWVGIRRMLIDGP